MSRSVRLFNQHTENSSPSTADAHDVKVLRQTEDELCLSRLKREQRIDEELAQSFPASDPPSWVSGNRR